MFNSQTGLKHSNYDSVLNRPIKAVSRAHFVTIFAAPVIDDEFVSIGIAFRQRGKKHISA
jgi:hypothetical protein